MDFQGFQSYIPVWLIGALVIASALLAWLSYKKYNNLPPIIKILLTSLRAAVFFILILLLLNPFFQRTDTRLLKPDFLIFADNTVSTAITKGHYRGEETYRQVLDELNLQNRDGINYESYLFGSELKPAPLDSLKLNQGETNLYNFVEIVKQKELSTKGVILISDGIFTFGQNPVFAAQDLSVPIFTIAVGDTQTVKDIVISSINTVPTGYVNTQHTIDAVIENTGFENNIVEVRLSDGENILESKSIKLNESGTQQNVSFQVDFETEGLKQYRVEVQSLSEEWSTENNSRIVTVDVIDTKTRVLHIAYEVHPDVKIIRNILSRDENIELITRTWIRGSQYIEGNIAANTDSLDLVVIQGLPGTSAPQFALSSLIDNLPTVFIHTPLSLSRPLPPNLSDLTLFKDSGRMVQQVKFSFAMSKENHPVLELPEIEMLDLPSVMAPFRGSALTPLSTSLFNVFYQSIETNQSIIAATEAGVVRRTHINAHGWYRIYQSGTGPQREFIRALFENIVNWTSENPDRRRLKVAPEKKVFNTGENVLLKGFLTNESGEEEADAKIDVRITAPDNSSRIFTMQNNGGGNYSLSVNSGVNGTYTYEVTAQKGNRTIDRANGEYIVDKSSDELINTVRNDQLLKSLAAQTGGKFYTYSNVNELWADLNQSELLTQEKVSETQFHFIIHSPIWFLIVIVLLATEWACRKYYALT